MDHHVDWPLFKIVHTEALRSTALLGRGFGFQSYLYWRMEFLLRGKTPGTAGLVQHMLESGSPI